MKRWVQRPEGSNWGDLGDDDQIGRMNLITPARRLAGMAEVKEGIAFALSLPLDMPGGPGALGRSPPRLFSEEKGYNALGDGTYLGCCDVVSDDGVVLFNQYSTQWDALSHWGQAFDADGDGIAEFVYYNGFRAGEHILSPGGGAPRAVALGIEKLAQAAPQGRAAFVNLHRIYGDDPVDVGYDALMRAFEVQKINLEPGDFLLLYTGLDQLILRSGANLDRTRLRSSCAALKGSDPLLRRWITDSGVVALCSDAPAVERPNFNPRPSESALPLHTHALFGLGVHFGELWYLAELAAWLWAHGRSACLLTAPPLCLPGAVGSPTTPIATV